MIAVEPMIRQDHDTRFRTRKIDQPSKHQIVQVSPRRWFRPLAGFLGALRGA
jgi:hypothetical protein